MNYTLVLMGKSKVGKTAWLNKIKKNDVIVHKDNQFNIVELVDQKGIKTDKPIHGALIMCDVCDNQLTEVVEWKKYLDQQNIKPVVLMVNKVDIETDQEVDYDHICKTNNIHQFVGLSVEDDYNLFG